MSNDFKAKVKEILDQVGARLLGKEEALARIKALRETPVVAPPRAGLTYFREHWGGPAAAGSGLNETARQAGTVLVIDDTPGLAEALRRTAGVGPVIWARPAAAFERNSGESFSFRAGQKEDVERLVGSLPDSGQFPQRIVQVGSGSAFLPDLAVLSEQMSLGAELALLLLQATLRRRRKEAIHHDYLCLGADTALSPAHACVAGLFKEAGLEHANFTGHVCRFETMEAGAVASALASRLWRAAASSVEVAVSGDGSVFRGRSAERIALSAPERPVLRERGVCLVTGGAGGLGFLFARHLAASSRARLVLAGRSPLSEEIQSRLRALENLGAEARYIRADAGRPGDLEAAVAEARAAFGPVNAVIHAAGIMPYGRTADIRVEDMRAVWRSKIEGTLLLDGATRGEPLDWMALFSSISSVIGVAEACGYASGNAFMDSFADWRAAEARAGRRSGRTVSLNWPLWETGGMRVGGQAAEAWKNWMWSSQGMRPLGAEAGLAAFEAGMNSGEGRIIVADGDPERVARTLVRGLGWRPDSSGESLAAKPVKAASAAATGTPRETLVAVLKGMVGSLLSVPEEAVNLKAGLGEFGFDSISLKAFAERLNERFKLDLMPSVFFSHSSLNALADHLLAAHPAVAGSFGQREQERPPEPALAGPVSQNEGATGGDDPIAIVGLSGVLPGSPDLEAFWSHLEAGDDLISEIPPSRWDPALAYQSGAAGEGKTNSKWGGFIPEVDGFDARFFGIPPWEADRMDPQHRLFLETAWNCLESAGEPPGALSGRSVGVFVGIQFHEYQDLLSLGGDLHMYNATGNGHAMIANRLSYFLNLRGPSESVDTACSSSLVALNRAVSAIRGGECESAIVGGVSLILSPGTLVVTSQMGILSPDGRCKVFDAAANGYVKGEGALAAYLMPLSKARSGGYPVWGLVRGSGVNHGGRASSLTAPNARAQTELLVNTYRRAGVDPETVGYIEAHGTGTELGDPVEVEGLKSAFAELAGKPEWASPFCGIGSVKSNIGHLEPAAGLAGAAKALLAMRHKTLPATLHLKSPNPYLKLRGGPFYLVSERRSWEPPRDREGRLGPRRAGVSSFGFGGTNAHVILEEDLPLPDGFAGEGLPAESVFVLSSKTGTAARRRLSDLAVWLASPGRNIALRDLARTLQMGRDHFEFRWSVVASGVDELNGILAILLGGGSDARARFGQAAETGRELADAASCGASALAEAFVRGDTIDWSSIHAGRPFRRVSLPGYPFEKTRHWFRTEKKAAGTPAPAAPMKLKALLAHPNGAEDQARGAGNGSSDPKPATGASGSPDPAPKLDHAAASRGEVIRIVKQIVATALYLDESSLDEGKSFVDLGSDSILGVEIIRRINSAFRVNLPASKLYEYPNVGALSGYVAGLGAAARPAPAAAPPPPAAQSELPAPVEPPINLKPGPKGSRVVVVRSGDVEDLTFSDAPPAAPGEREIQVEVHAASVILPDLLCLRGLYPTMPAYPFTPGFEFAGVVRGVGSGATLHKPGDSVFGVTGDHLGAHAPLLIVREDLAVRVPSALAMREAATIPEAFLTAYFALIELGRLEEGERILIHSAASGTGLAAVQLARWRKAEIFATVGSEEKAEYLRSLGVARVVNYREGDLAGFCAEAIGPRGVDVVLNMLTGEPREAALRCLAPFGRFLDLAVGGLRASGRTDLSSMVSNQVYHSVDCRQLYSRDTGRIQRILRRLVELLAAGQIRPLRINRVFDFTEAADAYVLVRDRIGIGKTLLCRAGNALENKPQSLVAPAVPLAPASQEVAVIGLAGRFPGAANVVEFWRLLSEGRCAVREVPANRWAADEHFDPDPAQPGKTYSKWGGFLEGADLFDPLFFNISPAEAEQMDPQQRVFLETAWHALEDAGYAGESMSGAKCGVFVGAGQGDYVEAVRQTGGALSAQLLMGSSCSMIGARLAYFMNLTGPAVAVDTACSSSLVAIYQACQSLLAGDSDLALAGGVCVMTTPAMYVMMSKAGMLSPTGLCRTFDQKADGFAPGEGAGLVVLKRLDRALKDGDQIYGVIKGAGSNQDGATNGITAPNPAAQKALEMEVYRRSGVDPDTIGYVEAHGTGTKLGDPIEIDALTEAFRAFTQRRRYCAIGSVKTNIGHALSAAGIASVIKTLLCLRHQKLVPSLHYERRNEHLELESSPFYVNTELTDWTPPNGSPRRAAVSSFGFSGTNVHLVLEEAPARPAPSGLRKPAYLFALSARADDILRERLDQLAGWLEEGREEPALESVAYSLNAGRTHFRKRCYIVADSLASMRKEAARARFGEAARLGEDARAGGGRRARELVAELASAGGSPLRYVEILHELGGLYVAGVPLDWERLHEGEPKRRLSLPGYPFKKMRCWSSRPSREAPVAAKIIGTETPLPDENNPGPGGARFTRTIRSSDWLAKDHLVRGVATMPGVAFLEMARAAGLAAGAGRSVAAIRQVVLPQPLPIESDPVAVETVLNSNDAGAAFEIRSLRGGGPVLHAQGIVDFGEIPAAPESVSIGEIEAGFSKRTAKSGVYEFFHRAGLQYGSAFQSVAWLAVSAASDTSIARVELPPGLVAGREAYFLHPALLDGALQAIAGWSLFGRDEAPFALPFEIREVLLFGPLTDTGYARARRERGSGAAGIARYNVQFFDDTGRERCRLNGLAMKALTRGHARGIESGATPGERDGRANTTRLFRPVWVRRKAPASGAPRQGPLLVLEENDSRFAAVAALQPGAVQVRTGGSFEILGRDVYQVRPESEEDFRRLLTTVFGSGRSEAGVLHLWGCHDASGRPLEEDGALLSTFALTRALLGLGFSGLRLAQACGPLQAGLIAGWARTLALEHSNFRCVAVESGGDYDPDFAVGLLKELGGEMREPEVRIVPEGRVVASYEDYLAALVRPQAFRNNGVYLITGGLGGLGRLVAGHVARTAGGRVALMARSEPTAEQRRWIESLTGRGGEAAYWKAEVANLGEVKQVVAAVGRRFGALHGVIHAAGLLRDARVIKKGADEIRAVLAPKIRGAANLDEATRHFDLDFFAVFSSAAGALGNVGQCDYAAANAWLDRFAEERETRRAAGTAKGRTVSINWPWWREGGMRPSDAAIDWMRATWGLEGLETADGLRVLDEILRSDATRALVLCGDERRWGEIARRRESAIENRAAKAPTGSDSMRLRNQMIRLMAHQLKVDGAEIDQDEDFSAYGFDSISLTEFSNRLNRACGIETTPALFFEHPTVSSLARHLLATYPNRFMIAHPAVPSGATPTGGQRAQRPEVEPPPPAPPAGKEGGRWIAVIAAQGRFPGAANVGEFWNNLEQGRDSVSEVPPERWDWRKLPPEMRHARWGGFIEGIDLFDAGLFGISRREAELMDPQQRLFLETVWTLLEEAGYPSSPAVPSSVGLFAGVSTCDYAELLGGGSVAAAHSPTGLSHSILVNRASHLLNLTGPSEAVNTACSSSLAALHRAVRALRGGECDLAVAAGVSAILTPTTTLGFLQAGMLSRDGRCKTFDAAADGYVRGEGVGGVLLKRWADAVRDGDTVHGVILGSAVNHGGRTNTLTAPNPAAQSEVVLAACRDAGIDVSSISYVEAHGTGTALGDPIEFNGLKKAFAAGGSDLAPGSCGLGAVKSNIGHLEAAAGIAGVIKVLLSLRSRRLPATLHVREVNPYIKMEGTPFRIIRGNEEWAARRDDTGRALPLRAGVSSFGFGGANAHVVIGEGPPAPEARAGGAATKPWCLAAISARDQKALAAKIRDLAAWLRREGSNHSLEDICHTLNAGRHHLFRRLALLIRTREELLSSLEQLDAGAEAPNAMAGERIRVKPEDEAMFRVVWESVSATLPGSASTPEIYREKLSSVAGLYLKGCALDWSVVHEGETRRRLPLPTYPFQRESYWVPSGAEPCAAAEQPAKEGGAPLSPRARLLSALASEAAGLLKAGPEEVRLDENLSEFGFDSLNLKSFAAALSARFGVSLAPNLFFIYPTLNELADHLAESFPERIAASLAVELPPAPVESVAQTVPPVTRPRPAFEEVVVVGMGGVFPGSPDLDAFWSNLAAGRDMVGEVPASRWDWRETYGDARRAPGKTNSKWGGFIDDVDCFDAGFFGISPREAEMMDPQQRLFLEAAWKAVESAGLAPERLSGTPVGVFLGIQFNDYQELLARAGVADAYSGTGNAHSIAANRISYLLNLTGPSETIDTACSSSLVAVHRAVQSLRLGECDAALAGGVNLMLSPSAFVATSQLGALSPDGRCRVFDAGANGYVRGEGAGAVFLMRLSDAERAGCPILGIIRGSAVNHGGKAQSLTAPNARAQAALLRKTYDEAGIDPGTISYVETHGTGTELGDPVEIEGLKAAFAPRTGRNDGAAAARSCGLGSVKSNIGHLEAAAGAAGLIKVLLALRHGLIPANLHFQKLNPFIQIEGSPFYIVDRPTAWEGPAASSGGIPRRAGVSSFGFGGANAHIVLEEGPRAEPPEELGLEHDYLFTISGRTEEALRRRLEDLTAWLKREGEFCELSSVSRTLNEGRGHYEHRAAAIASSLPELIRALGQLALPGVAGAPARNAGSSRPSAAGAGLSLQVRETLDRLRQPPGVLNGSRRKYLEELADLYLQGGEVDWPSLHDSGRPWRRVALPAYPFARKRYWVPAPASRDRTPPDETQASGAKSSPDDADRLRLLTDFEERRISLNEAVEQLRRA